MVLQGFFFFLFLCLFFLPRNSKKISAQSITPPIRTLCHTRSWRVHIAPHSPSTTPGTRKSSPCTSFTARDQAQATFIYSVARIVSGRDRMTVPWGYCLQRFFPFICESRSCREASSRCSGASSSLHLHARALGLLCSPGLRQGPPGPPAMPFSLPCSTPSATPAHSLCPDLSSGLCSLSGGVNSTLISCANAPVDSQWPHKSQVRRLGWAQGLLWERAVIPGESQEERVLHPSYSYIQQHPLTGLTGPLPAAGSAQLPLCRLLQGQGRYSLLGGVRRILWAV